MSASNIPVQLLGISQPFLNTNRSKCYGVPPAPDILSNMTNSRSKQTGSKSGWTGPKSDSQCRKDRMQTRFKSGPCSLLSGSIRLLRPGVFISKVNHPGGNQGANRWFLWSTPIQMPPELGGICRRLTYDLPLGCVQVGVVDRLEGVPREQNMLKGHLPRVTYHQLY